MPIRLFPRRNRLIWVFLSLFVVSSFVYYSMLTLPRPDFETENVDREKIIDTQPKIADLYHPSSKVITFYYPWYGNPAQNDLWIHWNHQILVDKGAYYQPPDDIGANFYPSLGPYSSTDPVVIDQHMKWMASSRIGVLCTSWWGRSASDSQLLNVKGFTDALVTKLLDAADKYGLKVAIHLEPYNGRNAKSVKEDLKYLISEYGNHPALHRDSKNRPFVFVYDSYHTNPLEWATILSSDGANTIRGTDHDAVMIALFVDHNDRNLIVKGNFDGFYTYFATDGFTKGSSVIGWKELNQWANENNKIFIPSVGPGYADTRIRPWNTANQRSREGGAYYDRMFQSAIDLSPEFISITSFNEWHEGTQIEPSVSKEVNGYKYDDFAPQGQDFYLEKTKSWIDRYDPL